MASFRYFCPTHIEMGISSALRLPDLLHPMGVGSTVLLVADPGVLHAGLVDPISASLESGGFSVHVFSQLVKNPRDTDCLRGAERFREVDAKCVVAVGGGSAMDTAKTIALLGPNGGEPSDYADGRRPYEKIAPIVCVPTTAGTGSEVTRSAVITEASTHRKMTLKHASLRPQLAVLDPALTYSVPPSVTAATGIDALVHAIEGYTCKVTNPICQAFGASAMQTIVAALPIAVRDGQNVQARSDMLEGSLLAGLCFGSSDVAAVHCLAEALGGLYDTPHGVANSVFLPYVLRFNAETEVALHAQVARHMGYAKDADSDSEAVERLIRGVAALTREVGIPGLSDLPGVTPSDFDELADLAWQNGSTPSNARSISKEDYRRILNAAYEGE